MRAARSAGLAFAAIEVAGLVTYLVLGRNLWFYSDEWDYFVDRHPFSDPASLVRPHNGQWQTIPILIYRALFRITGLRTYWPYLVAVVVLYLVVCALVYALMLRARVRPWLAVPLAGTLVFLGFASENVIFAAQLTYLGSIACGLAELLVLAGGRSRRRLVVAVLLAIAALACSNLGVVMAIAAAAAALLRHGWRTAAVITAPPAAAFAIWWSVFDTATTSGAGDTLRFVGTGLRAGAEQFSRRGTLGAALVATVLAAGLLLAVLGRRDWSERLCLVVPLAVGALAFLVLTGSQRAGAFGVGTAAAPRYLGVVIVLLVPVAGVAVDAVWSAVRPAGALALLIMLIGVPGNVRALSQIGDRAAHIDVQRSLILALPHLPATARAPADQRPFPESTLAPLLTVGFVRQAAARGWLPAGPPPSAAVRADDEFRLALYQTDRSGAARDCRALTAPVTVDAPAGTSLRLAGGFVRVVNLSPGPQHGLSVYYNPNRGDVLQVRGGDYELRLSSQGTNGPARLCQA